MWVVSGFRVGAAELQKKQRQWQQFHALDMEELTWMECLLMDRINQFVSVILALQAPIALSSCLIVMLMLMVGIHCFWNHFGCKMQQVVHLWWHRMSYTYKDSNFISQELETHIRKIHAIVANAVTHKRFIVFGAGSTQLLNAAVHALSPDNSSSPARVVASIPFYPLYEKQTVYFQSADFKFEGDISVWKNSSDTSMNLVEFVTAPNNPDGQMNKAVLKGPNIKTIHDHAYYWPHYTPITAPADGNLMIFSTSKLTSHAGSRFGWAVIKDESVYQKMYDYMGVNTMGVSRDTQLRALKLLKVVLESGGREIFEFGHNTMRNRWEKLSNTISLSNRFTLQQIPPQYCTFFHKVRASSPAFAWVKCEREEDINCHEVLKAAKIIGRAGRIFQGLDQYVRLSLLRSQDDFDLLIHRLSKLVSEWCQNYVKNLIAHNKSTKCLEAVMSVDPSSSFQYRYDAFLVSCS
ncbi:hypothetical protein QYF36_024750 [Acer negundo]|nr:hypothetical protein QYF36_024750 [Acer negundo]